MNKKNLLAIGIGLLLGAIAMPTYAQFVTDVCSDDNEDGVVKINSRLSQHDYVPGEVLVKFKDENRVQVNASRGQFQSSSVSRLTQVLQKYGTKEMEQLMPDEHPNRQLRRSRAYNGDIIQERDLSQLYCVKLSEEHAMETMQLVNELNDIDEVEYAEPNYRLHTLTDETIATNYSNNPFASQQWYLNAYGVTELWDKPIVNSTRPVIAIIDTGVDITHPDLKDNLWTNQREANGRDNNDNDYNGYKNDIHGWDFINNTAKIRDNNKHGTHVAGIAAAVNNGIGIIGANPQALIMPVTVMQSDGTGDVATIVKGINYAVKNGATVLNMSIGTYANSSSLRQALEIAYQSAVIVAAAGNDGLCIYNTHWKKHPTTPCFPAAYSFVLGVQATVNAAGSLASFSNYDDDGPLTSCESTATDPDGFNYELEAPGVNILSCIPGGKYDLLHGTSMAAPLVAGAISALQMVKQYDNQEILWADLLHANNIAEAYQVSSRPAELNVMRIILRDRNEQAEYNEDEDTYLKYYDVNVGETINIFPVVRSSFGKASNVKLKIVVPSGIEVIDETADFGYTLDAFGNTVSKSPLVIKVPDEMPNASTITVRIEATCDESDKTASASFNLRVCNMYTLKGLLTEDMTLTADHVYYVSSNFGVNQGTTLTIEPGTRIEFAKGKELKGWGKLNIKGTPEKPIVFAPHNTNESWTGISVHDNRNKCTMNGVLYTNPDSTLFTLCRTDATPNIFKGSGGKELFYDTEENKPVNLYLADYLDDKNSDLTGRTHLLTDPNYLTPAVLRLLQDWKSYFLRCSTNRTTEKPNRAYVWFTIPSWSYYADPIDTISYCRIENGSLGGVASDCAFYTNGELIKTTAKDGRFENIVNQRSSHSIYQNKDETEMNFVNNYLERNGNIYMIEVYCQEPLTVKKEILPYFGTSREDFLRPFIYELGNTDESWIPTFGTLDLSNIRKEPYHEAHGIVWKILVNGKDAQDEQEQLQPLGIGKHKFEVYFNRPMNKAVVPIISYGVISPYNQHTIAEDGEWNLDGTIYTAYTTIDGNTRSDGMNRIYVRGAEDNEFFECPYEATRFNFMIQSSSSMASGFQADAGFGCVRLTWNNENNDFEDAMGFNVYRFNPDVKRTIPGHYDENWRWVNETEVVDTVRLNEVILDITTTSYIDDDVTPGQTYYYYYKVLSTALKEYDVSNVVAVTPLTATRGDANGNGDVDVADVITTVNYMTGLAPKPFVFDAADMNSDHTIDVFDVVGIIRGIMNPSLLATASTGDMATFSVEDGVLYVESPIALAGVQVQICLDEKCSKEDVRAAQDMDGFEQASAWLTDNDYLFLGYSMNGTTLTPGKHAIMTIGDADITSIRLSDVNGNNVVAVPNEATLVKDAMGSKVMTTKGIYNLSGQKIVNSKSSNRTLHKGVYIINGKKVVK